MKINEIDLLLELNKMTKAQRRTLFVEARASAAKVQVKGRTIAQWETWNGSKREAVRVHGTRLWAVRDPEDNHRVINYLQQTALLADIADGRGPFFFI